MIKAYLKYQPKKSWLANSNVIDHNIDHLARVFVWAEYLAHHYNIEDREPLRWAAILHDIRRNNDEIDNKHGLNASEWLQKQIPHKIGSEHIHEVIELCRDHNRDISEPPLKLNILKDADTLDRIRFGGVDKSRLNLEISKRLIGKAHKLYSATSQVSNTVAFQVVLYTAHEFGLFHRFDGVEFSRSARFWASEDDLVITRNND